MKRARLWLNGHGTSMNQFTNDCSDRGRCQLQKSSKTEISSIRIFTNRRIKSFPQISFERETSNLRRNHCPTLTLHNERRMSSRQALTKLLTSTFLCRKGILTEEGHRSRKNRFTMSLWCKDWWESLPLALKNTRATALRKQDQNCKSIECKDLSPFSLQSQKELKKKKWEFKMRRIVSTLLQRSLNRSQLLQSLLRTSAQS